MKSFFSSLLVSPLFYPPSCSPVFVFFFILVRKNINPLHFLLHFQIVDAAIVRLTETKQQLETAQATSSSQWTSLQTAQSNTDKLLHIKVCIFECLCFHLWLYFFFFIFFLFSDKHFLPLQTELNKSNWQVINREEDGWVLFVIVLEWFCSLKEPVVPQSSMATILTFEVDHSEAAVTKILNRYVVTNDDKKRQSGKRERERMREQW